ncbi:MAG: AI-2E family transporter [Gemmatimonadaceae bacterium]|nr:AI-2E family transporter [Gemmatimonadaceae bacterium]
MLTPDSSTLASASLLSADGSEQFSPPKPTGKYRAAAIIIVLGFGILWAMLPFAPGILGAAVFYVLTIPAFRWMVARKVPRSLAAMVLLLVVLLVILVPGGALVTVLIDEIPAAIRGLDAGPLVKRVQGLRVGPINVAEQLSRASGTISQWVSSQVLGAVGGAARGTLNLVISLLGLYYLLLAAEDVWPRIKRYLPFTDDDSEDLRVKFYEVTMATALGVVVVAVAQGALVGAAFMVLGLPNSIVWGTVTAIASVLPLFGSALVWVPACIALFATGNVGQAVGLGIFGGVVVSNVDNIMRPIVSKRVGNLHPLTTLLGAFAGIEYVGLIGILLGPLAITWFLELMVIYDKEYGLTDRFSLLTKS